MCCPQCCETHQLQQDPTGNRMILGLRSRASQKLPLGSQRFQGHLTSSKCPAEQLRHGKGLCRLFPEVTRV